MNKKKLLALTFSIVTVTAVYLKAEQISQDKDQKINLVAQDTKTIRLTFEVTKNEQSDEAAWKEIITIMSNLALYASQSTNDINDMSWIDESAKALKATLALICGEKTSIPGNASIVFSNE